MGFGDQVFGRHKGQTMDQERERSHGAGAVGTVLGAVGPSGILFYSCHLF